MSRIGLGRGLASLIPDSALDGDSLPAPREALRIVPLDEVRPNPEQPRELFDAAKLEELAASIRAHGILCPLVVRRHEGRYVVIAGERRLRAAALAGLTEVPVVVRTADDAREQLELALVENLQRDDLDAIESARGFHRLMDEYGHTQDQVAKSVGKKRATVANALRLLRLPDFVVGALRDRRISAGHARALVPLADDDEALRRMLAKIVAESLNVRQLERLVSAKVRTPGVIAADRRRKERALEYAEKILSESLHTAVAIQQRQRGGGRIVIDFADAEDLERLIQHLRAGG